MHSIIQLSVHELINKEATLTTSYKEVDFSSKIVKKINCAKRTLYTPFENKTTTTVLLTTETATMQWTRHTVNSSHNAPKVNSFILLFCSAIPEFWPFDQYNFYVSIPTANSNIVFWQKRETCRLGRFFCLGKGQEFHTKCIKIKKSVAKGAYKITPKMLETTPRENGAYW